jgi:Zn-dependent protease with chaperone function
MWPPSNRFRWWLAAGAGKALRLVDRASALLYIAGTFGMGGMLVWYAFSKTLWLLLLAVPVLVTGLVLALAFQRNPDLGLRFEWPQQRRWVRPRNHHERSSSNKAPKP